MAHRLKGLLAEEAAPKAVEKATRDAARFVRRDLDEKLNVDQYGAREIARAGQGLRQGEHISWAEHDAARGSDSDVGEVAALIEQRSAELGLRTPAQRALESRLLIDEPLHQAALITHHPHPELLFGEKEWAGYLEARTFARQHGDRELDVPFIAELHQRLARFADPDIAGIFAHSKRWGVRVGSTFTHEEAAFIKANPYLEYLPRGTVPLGPAQDAYEYRISSPDEVRAELQSMSDWYNNARNQPGTDPYRLAAQLQQRFVSIHPFLDYNGRSSRLLMNWSLERDGLPPSAPMDFNKDIFSTTEEWTDSVRAGSDAFGERAARLEHLGETADPVEVFGLEREHERYRTLGGMTATPLPGAGHDIKWYQSLLEQLRGNGQ